jgi:hypothetical protein
MCEKKYTEDRPRTETIMGGRSLLKRVDLVPRMAIIFLLSGLLLFPPTVAGQDPYATFVRNYTATSTVAIGDPSADGILLGGSVCNGGHDTPSDTGACLYYRVGTLFDFRGQAISVQVDDLVHGSNTWALVVVHMDSSGWPDCSRDACFFGQGTIPGHVPADAEGHLIRVLPLTYHSSDLLCCPEGSASSGEIRITIFDK